MVGKYVIGIDYGTLSVRALLVEADTGTPLAASVYEYPHGVMETQLPTGKRLLPNFALQHPRDYLEGLFVTVQKVRRQAEILPEELMGIGLDFTSSTLLPVTEDGTPVCFLPEFADEPHAYVKLWKHHGCEEEAEAIERAAKIRREAWLPFYGGKVNAEWMLPKILETLRRAPRVHEAADFYLEAQDWLVQMLTGERIRSACGAGYKAFYRPGAGYPAREFLKAVDPGLSDLAEGKLAGTVKPVGERAGFLTEEMAEALGLAPGTPVGVGMIDAHASLLGSGICKPGVLLVIVGTSSCHILLSEKEVAVPGAECVKDGILPGYFAYEAGQSCVGDLFAWFTKNCVPESYIQEAKARGMEIHRLLEEKLRGYRAGQSGLIALDWYNGVRSPLMDYQLSGLILGMDLLTKPEEIYLALMEATAYGTRLILESFEKSGIPVESLVLGGGIPGKNRTLVQIYADVCNRSIRIAENDNASALGAAILGAAAAPAEVSGYHDLKDAVKKLGKTRAETYYPNPENADVYNELYQEYKLLHEYFGTGSNHVMKKLKFYLRVKSFQ